MIAGALCELDSTEAATAASPGCWLPERAVIREWQWGFVWVSFLIPTLFVPLSFLFPFPFSPSFLLQYIFKKKTHAEMCSWQKKSLKEGKGNKSQKKRLLKWYKHLGSFFFLILLLKIMDGGKFGEVWCKVKVSSRKNWNYQSIVPELGLRLRSKVLHYIIRILWKLEIKPTGVESYKKKKKSCHESFQTRIEMWHFSLLCLYQATILTRQAGCKCFSLQ